MKCHFVKAQSTVKLYCVLRTIMENFRSGARLTLNFTAPQKPAVTIFPDYNLVRGVTVPTTQQITAPWIRRVWHTFPTLSPQWPELFIFFTEIRRWVWIYKVILGWGFDSCSFRNNVFPVIRYNHSDGAVKAFLEPITHVSEGRHLLPASLESAGAGQSVTLALTPHVVLHRLETQGIGIWQTLIYINTYIHKHLYTQTLIHTHFNTLTSFIQTLIQSPAKETWHLFELP